MRSKLDMWKCECCRLSNPHGFERCSYCGLPALHTVEELAKYKQALPGIKNRDENIWLSLGSAFLAFIFETRPYRWTVAFLLVFGLLSVIPFVKNNILVTMLVSMILVFGIGTYLYVKNK